MTKWREGNFLTIFLLYCMGRTESAGVWGERLGAQIWRLLVSNELRVGMSEQIRIPNPTFERVVEGLGGLQSSHIEYKDDLFQGILPFHLR
jgi:hypothetical protein